MCSIAISKFVVQIEAIFTMKIFPQRDGGGGGGGGKNSRIKLELFHRRLNFLY